MTLEKIVSETRVKDASGTVKAKSQIVYDHVASYPFVTVSGDYQWEDPGTNYRGNPSTTKGWYEIAGNGYVETHAQYDAAGNTVLCANMSETISCSLISVEGEGVINSSDHFCSVSPSRHVRFMKIREYVGKQQKRKKAAFRTNFD